jgi:hypothetical protein
LNTPTNAYGQNLTNDAAFVNLEYAGGSFIFENDDIEGINFQNYGAPVLFETEDASYDHLEARATRGLVRYRHSNVLQRCGWGGNIMPNGFWWYNPDYGGGYFATNIVSGNPSYFPYGMIAVMPNPASLGGDKVVVAMSTDGQTYNSGSTATEGYWEIPHYDGGPGLFQQIYSGNPPPAHNLTLDNLRVTTNFLATNAIQAIALATTNVASAGVSNKLYYNGTAMWWGP